MKGVLVGIYDEVDLDQLGNDLISISRPVRQSLR